MSSPDVGRPAAGDCEEVGDALQLKDMVGKDQLAYIRAEVAFTSQTQVACKFVSQAAASAGPMYPWRPIDV